LAVNSRNFFQSKWDVFIDKTGDLINYNSWNISI
jgi:hypothetical protein